jgi:hypothetical protein
MKIFIVVFSDRVRYKEGTDAGLWRGVRRFKKIKVSPQYG